jgi:hypothetical protein
MDIFFIRMCKDLSGGSGSGGGGVANDVAYGPLGYFMNTNDQTNQNNINNAGNAISQIGNSVQQEGAMSPQAQSQLNQSYTTGQGLTSLETNALAGGNASQEFQNQGPLQQSLYNQVSAQAANPTAGWQSSLQPQLEQAQNQINEYYNARGLDNSGIAIGAMGTAGVDLAIQNAQNEMAYQQQSLNNAGNLSSNISTLNQQNTQNLQGLYGTQQNAGLSGISMQNQAYQVGAGYEAYPQQAALGSAYGQQAATQQLPGQLISAGGQLGAAYLPGA